MRLRNKTLFGRIDERGVLKIPVEAMEDFCRLHPGRAVILRLEVQSVPPSQRLTNYFFGYIVKEMRQAFATTGNDYSEEQTYDQIRANCPLFWEEKRENSSWKRRAKEWEELDSSEAVEAIAWIQRWASTEFFWIIEDPR